MTRKTKIIYLIVAMGIFLTASVIKCVWGDFSVSGVDSLAIFYVALLYIFMEHAFRKKAGCPKSKTKQK